MNPKTICYFGIYHPIAPRDRVYLDGLRALGVAVFPCVDNSRGFLKFWRLWKKHKTLRGAYDILWVGYLSTMVVPLARLISRKKVVFNALDSSFRQVKVPKDPKCPICGERPTITKLIDYEQFCKLQKRG